MTIIIVAGILLTLIALTEYFTKSRSLVLKQTVYEILVALLGVGAYYSAIKWLGFSFDYWATIGLLLGLCIVAIKFSKTINKTDIKMEEYLLLLIIPIPIFFLYGRDFTINIALGLYSGLLANSLFMLGLILSRKVDFSKIKLPSKKMKVNKSEK